MIRAMALVGIGGGIGSVFRYLTAVVVNKYFQPAFPWATFVANILGCLIIGLLLGFFERYHLANPDLKYLFVTGFCGGYTTFSTFAVENMNLFNSGNSLTAFAYIAASIIIGLVAVWLGVVVTK